MDFLINLKMSMAKGQLISKANYQAVNSSKKRTDSFGFFAVKSSYVAKSNTVSSFFGRISALKVPRSHTFNHTVFNSDFHGM